MTNSVFEKWYPIPNVSQFMYLESLHDSEIGVELLLKYKNNKDQSLKINFNSTLLYRKIDEGNFLMSIDESVVGWTFFLSMESEFLSWFHYQSQGIHELENVMHYAIYTEDDCIDILSITPPEVRLIETPDET